MFQNSHLIGKEHSEILAADWWAIRKCILTNLNQSSFYMIIPAVIEANVP